MNPDAAIARMLMHLVSQGFEKDRLIHWPTLDVLELVKMDLHLELCLRGWSEVDPDSAP